MKKLHEIAWIQKNPTEEWFAGRIRQLITGILEGSDNIPVRGKIEPSEKCNLNYFWAS